VELQPPTEAYTWLLLKPVSPFSVPAAQELPSRAWAALPSAQLARPELPPSLQSQAVPLAAGLQDAPQDVRLLLFAA
jgi:hypothetical protein